MAIELAMKAIGAGDDDFVVDRDLKIRWESATLAPPGDIQRSTVLAVDV